jgi:hypothetical protein
LSSGRSRDLDRDLGLDAGCSSLLLPAQRQVRMLYQQLRNDASRAARRRQPPLIVAVQKTPVA